MIRPAAGLIVLIGAGALGAQENPGLEAGLHAVLAHGDLLDIQALSSDLGVEIYLPPTDRSGRFFRGAVTHSPPTMYANGLSFTVIVDENPPTTHVELGFSPRECSGLRNWAEDWNQKVEFGLLTDGAGSWSSLHWGDPEGVTLSATYFSGGGCSFALRQTLGRAVMPRFTEALPQPPRAQFEQEIAELVRHGDLRDYQWTAKILNADLQAGRSELRDGRLFKGGLKLAQVIPGVRAESFSYYANDTGWTDFPGALVYMGKKIAEQFVQLSFALETQQVCLPPTHIATSLQQFGIPYRTDSNGAAVRYEVEGNNAISMDVFPSQEQQCVAFVTIRQTTDARHSIKTPVEFTLQDSLEADRLSGAALQRMDLIGQRLQGKTVKQVVIFTHPVAKADQSDQTLARLTDLLRAALVEKGVLPELIRLQEGPMGALQAKAEGSAAIDVLIQ